MDTLLPPVTWPVRAAAAWHRARHDIAATRGAGWLVLALLAAILAPICVLYWQTPNDLIPDRVPVFGRVDDLGVIMASLAALRQAAARLAELAPDFADGQPGLVLAFGRAVLLGLMSNTLGPILYRASLGSWPTRQARRCFTDGLLRRDVPLPPLLRGLAETPAGTKQIRTLLQLTQPPREGAALLPPASARRMTVPPLSGDPLTFWRGPRVAFLHIEKSAGTSVLGVLTAQFHPGQIDPDPLRTLPPHVLHRLPAQARAARLFRLVRGHYDLPYLEALGPEFFRVIFLRDPRRRLLSLYHYWRSVTPAVLATEGGNHTIALAHKLSLDEFLTSDDPILRPSIDNIYTRRLIGAYGHDLPPDAANRAVAALARLDFVGITETIDESLAALATRLRFPVPSSAPRANVTAEIARADPRFRPAPRPQPGPAAEAALSRLTRLDQIVYEAALARQG